MALEDAELLTSVATCLGRRVENEHGRIGYIKDSLCLGEAWDRLPSARTEIWKTCCSGLCKIRKRVQPTEEGLP